MELQQHTDSHIVLRLKQGDNQAFAQVFNMYGENMVRYAVTLLKDQDDAEDIIQQLFVQLWTKRENLEVTTSLKSYLYRSVHNSCLNKIKQTGVRERYASEVQKIEPAMAAAASQLMERKEIARAIEEAMNELPEQCRKVFRMSRFDQLKYQQIADALGISVKTVENQMGKALKHMRSKLQHLAPAILVYLFLGN